MRTRLSFSRASQERASRALYIAIIEGISPRKAGVDLTVITLITKVWQDMFILRTTEA